METKHTPGPWALGLDSDFIYDSKKEDANIICQFFDDYDYANKYANAKTMVAAPDLLEAAQLAKQFIDYAKTAGLNLWSDKLQLMYEASNSLDKAIKKATE